MDDVHKRNGLEQLKSPPLNEILSLLASNSTPKCAICLGACNKICFANSCTHKFCFTCLVKWSKVKAECPLCKQPFQWIYYNFKTRNKYDKYVIPPTVVIQDDIQSVDDTVPSSSRRSFQIDSVTSLAFWHANQATPFAVNPTHTRDVSPQFFRAHPVARQRLIPWLVSKLNELLFENPQHVMLVIDVIMEQLVLNHILSYDFRFALIDFLGASVDHFIHQLYLFAQCTCEFIRGLLERNLLEAEPVDIASEDDDVVLVPGPPIDTIEIESDSNNSDVIIEEPEPPVVVDLLDSDVDDRVADAGEEQRQLVVPPLRISLKHRKKKSKKSHKRSRRERDRSSGFSSCDSDDATRRRKEERRKSKKKKRSRKHHSSNENSYDTDDNIPLIHLIPKREPENVLEMETLPETMSVQNGLV